VSAKDWRPLIAEIHAAEPWPELDILPWVEAQIHVESRGVADAQSHAGARGLMQIMPSTAAGEFGVTADRLDDPKTNVTIGMKYLRQLYDSFSSRVPDDRERLLWAFAAYNGGGAYARKALKLCRDDTDQMDEGSHPAYWRWDFARHWYVHKDCCITVPPDKVLRPIYRETWNYIHRIRKHQSAIKGEVQ
jgi:membrane-bound lytic murein transglycosylase MltF